MSIRVVLTGALGRMGRVMLAALACDPEIEIVGAVDVKSSGETLAELHAHGPALTVSTDLPSVLAQVRPDVLVDFTNGGAAVRNAAAALAHNVRPVIGSTGLSEEDLSQLHLACEQRRCGGIVAPNFALGAILMMRFAKEAAKYYPHAEVIEMHHDGKLDSPSGTAIATARGIAENRKQVPNAGHDTYEKTAGARGGAVSGIPVHSVRLPGLVAHQEVIFGGTAETLTIRHDSLSRESFQAGMLLAVKRVIKLEGLVVGLENLL